MTGPEMQKKLERKGQLQKLSTPFNLTTKSRIELEEPAYFYDS